MKFIADTHVHVYPNHHLGALLDAAARGLSALATDPEDSADPMVQAGASLVLCLAESRDCHFFRDLREGRAALPDGWGIASGPDPAALCLRGPEAELLVVAGRQLVSTERLEVLALCTDADLSQSRPAAELVAEVRDAGGVPVLAWGLGKWLLGRGAAVRRIVTQEATSSLLLGDSTMRPVGWPEPAAMRIARRRGMGVLAGSDPLPVAGEEQYVARYGTTIRSRATGFREALLDPASIITPVGRRCGLAAVLRRWLQHRRAKG